MKLMDILLEDKGDKVDKVPKTKPKEKPKSQGASPGVQQTVDKIANRFYQKPEEPKPQFSPNDNIPSLSQLAKDSGAEEPVPAASQQDPALADLPKFNDVDTPEWNHNPFGDPNVGDNVDFRTGLQKGVDAIGQGIKKGFNKLKGNPLTPEPQTQQPGQIPQAWSPDQSVQPQQQVPQEPDQQEPDMPKMASLAQKQAGRGLGGKHWKWKPGQKVDVGFIKDLTVLGVDQYGAKLQAKNGGIYRFIPHRGLRKIG